MADKRYTADDLEILTLRQTIRSRPYMYIGSTDHAGVERVIWDLTAKSVHRALADQASRVQVVAHRDDSIEVTDDGRGMDLLDAQISSHFLAYQPALAGESPTPPIDGTLLGMSLVVPNALSSRFRVTTRFGDQTLRCEWTDGAEQGGSPQVLAEDWTGTSIRMWLDPLIFDDAAIPAKSLDQRIHELDAMTPDLHVTLSRHKP